MMIPSLLKSDGIQNVNVFPDPVGEIVTQSFCSSCARAARAWKIHGRTLNFFSTSVCNLANEGIENLRLDIGDDVRVSEPKCAEVLTQPHLQVVPVVEAW